MQLLFEDQRLWASSCWFLALKWAPNSALICVKNIIFIHRLDYKQVFLFSVSSWRRAIILRVWWHVYLIIFALTSELPHIILRFNHKKLVGNLVMKTTSAGPADSSKIPHGSQQFNVSTCCSTSKFGWPSWGSEYGEIPPVLANVWHLWRHVFCVYYWCIFFLVFEYIVCIRLCYWIFMISKNYGHIFSYCNGWNWRWTNRSWLTFGHDLIICWITGRFAHLEDFYLDTWQDQKL